MLDQLTEAVALVGGDWLTLKEISDGHIKGKVLDFEIRPMTFKGDPVFKKGTTIQRKEWVFTLQIPGHDGPQMLSLREGGQTAVAAALKEANCAANKGDTLDIWITKDKEEATGWPDYKATWTPAPAALGVPADDDDGF